MNVLITSVGRRSYMVDYFKDAISGVGEVHVSNSSNISPAFNRADKWVVTPLIYDSSYIPFLVDYCKKNSIDMIISLFDVDLYVLALNKEKFLEIGTRVIVSDADFIKVCNDKWLTYNYLKENDFLVPRTYVDFNEVMKDITDEVIKFPVIVKPRWGMGSLSIYIADNEEELRVFYKKIKREIQNSYMKYESQEDLDSSVIIQEMVCGQEYGLDIINDLNGNFVSVIVRKKNAMRSGETDCAIIENNKDIVSVGSRLGKLTNHIANLDVDIFYDGKNVYILEMNARFGGGYPFSHIAGVNLPKAIIQWSNNKKVSSDMLIAKEGILAHKDIELVELKK